MAISQCLDPGSRCGPRDDTFLFGLARCLGSVPLFMGPRYSISNICLTNSGAYDLPLYHDSNDAVCDCQGIFIIYFLWYLYDDEFL